MHSTAALRNRFCRRNCSAMQGQRSERDSRFSSLHRLRFGALLFLSSGESAHRKNACALSARLKHLESVGCLLFFTALVSADPALFRGSDKIEKRARGTAPPSLPGLSKNLAG